MGGQVRALVFPRLETVGEVRIIEVPALASEILFPVLRNVSGNFQVSVTSPLAVLSVPVLEKVYASRAVQCHPHGGQSDFAWLPARTPHGGASYVRRAERNRIDRHGGGIERLATRTERRRALCLDTPQREA